MEAFLLQLEIDEPVQDLAAVVARGGAPAAASHEDGYERNQSKKRTGSHRASLNV